MKCIIKSFDLIKTFSIVKKIFETYIPSEYDRKYKDLSIKIVIGLIYIMRGLIEQSKNDEIPIYFRPWRRSVAYPAKCPWVSQ
jgi:hypothetical protein